MQPEARATLKPNEVAALFNVDSKTVARWARAGRLSYFRTPGHQRRYYADEVNALLQATRRERSTP
jgi:excisionase family DNA binding protein